MEKYKIIKNNDMNVYFVKSFEEDHSTKILSKGKKKTFQTLDNIMRTKIIKPNTKSFGQKQRLSTTILSDNYTKTYRPQGIIFKTTTKPNYVLPFDLVLLSSAKQIIAHYYRIKNTLHIYYNHKLIDGYKRFIFKDIDAMVRRFKSPEDAWVAVNEFRTDNGYTPLLRSKYRLVEYNEAVFLKPIKIIPVTLFGYRPETKKLAEQYNLPYFRSAKKFYERTFNS